MFNTTSGIKRSFFNQTGNLQFNANLIIDNLFGSLNVGISGQTVSGLTGQNKINFYCNSGKIFDNTGRFIGGYRPNEQFDISGNVNSGTYDYFINGIPVSYGNFKPTGTYNYIYLQPTGITCQYNLYVNGEQPKLSIEGVNCFSGDFAATGYILNLNNRLPVKIYSGRFTNFSDSLPFSVSGIFTGDLFSSGSYFIIPSGFSSPGNYTGNLELVTNGGIFSLTTSINITGSPVPLPYSFDINGLNNILNGASQLYTSNIQCLSGSGIPIQVSLEYVMGSGNFYSNINVLTGFSGDVTGYILGSGLIVQGKTGIGTGIGGLFNNTGSGAASGNITGSYVFAMGTFSWPYSVLATGYGTGVRYSGMGTGTLITQITGIIVGESGFYLYNTGITGSLGVGNLKSIGTTGFIRGTGKIFYNSPLGFDKLYVHNFGAAIVNNFHYTSLSSLTSYFNSNTGVHLVTAIDDGSNTVTLSGLYGASTNVGLGIDDTNVGSLQVWGTSLSGGQDLGIGQGLVSLTSVTGFINTMFTGSGNYISTGAGTLAGSGSIIDYSKNFTGTWNLLTGIPFLQVDYWANGFYNAAKTKYLNNASVFYVDSTAFINVNYNNPYDNLIDVALLTVSGYGFNSGLSLLISGNG